MSYWDDLVSTALLGTQRRRFDPGGLPAPVRPLVPDEPEAGLLTAAAVLATYRRAGRVPARPGSRPAAPGRDERPLVPPAARRRLLRLPAELLPEWLDAVRERGLRVPQENLRALVDAARTRPPLRAPLAAAAGPAGAWLGERNPAWAFLASAVPGVVDDQAWEYGNALQRRDWLGRTLAADPPAARAALAATWASEPAGVRADFLAVLGEHLDAGDEPFLEAALDDRAAPVREAAADLLARLPGSRLAARMRERAARLVRADGDALAVTPPDLDDRALLRDVGGPQARAARQPADLLRAAVAATPLGHWAGFGAPAAVLTRPVRGCEPRVLHAGWADAAGRERDARWGAAVLPAIEPAAVDGSITNMVRRLPAAVQGPALAVLAAKLPPPAMASAVGQLPAPWPPELGTAVLDWIGTQPGNRGLGGAARAAAVRVPRACLHHPVATGPLPIGAAPWWRELAATLTVRREMHEELR
ncbi:DUF5691 domain-containing protein [Pseudonocardia adelaidensis]|uniref:DUF5691 domain-containing protein n=1 Tax=Pseudonocardia adelaidensis TaxID=648754 RepID=A0ABP9NHB9_9PSEU